MKLEHVAAFVLDSPWALTAPMRAVVADIIVRKVYGYEIGAVEADAVAREIEARRDRRPDGTASADGGATAVVPVHGVIVPRGEMLQDTSAGTTSAEAIGETLRAVAEMPGVDRIVLDVDSPGGNVAGVQELAAIVREVAADVEVVAVANHAMASAAYWLASGASEIVASPSASVGSIGVYALHEDISKRLEQKGITPTLISAGKFKVDGHPFGPLSETAREAAQASVDAVYGQFVADVARGRNRTEAAVRDGFGEGRAVNAREALSEGMVDRVATMHEVLHERREAGVAGGMTGVALDEAAPVRAEHWDRLLARHALLKRRRIDTDAI